MHKQHFEGIKQSLDHLQMIFAESQHATSMAEWLTEDETEECLFLIAKFNSYIADLRLCLQDRRKKAIS